MKTILVFLGILSAGCVVAQEIERINPEGMTRPTSYSHLVKYDKLMFIAGQVAMDGESNLVGEGDMAAQFRQVMENLKKVLASEGADFSDIVKITIYTVDVDTLRNTVMDIRAEYFGDNAPASTLVGIERLASPEFLVEIEAIAIKPRI